MSLSNKGSQPEEKRERSFDHSLCSHSLFAALSCCAGCLTAEQAPQLVRQQHLKRLPAAQGGSVVLYSDYCLLLMGTVGIFQQFGQCFAAFCVKGDGRTFADPVQPLPQRHGQGVWQFIRNHPAFNRVLLTADFHLTVNRDKSALCSQQLKTVGRPR